jgi:hypothetical protein
MRAIARSVPNEAPTPIFAHPGSLGVLLRLSPMPVGERVAVGSGVVHRVYAGGHVRTVTAPRVVSSGALTHRLPAERAIP